MKKLLLFSLGATILFSACNKKDDPPPTPAAPKAKVMFGNAYVSTDTVKVTVNNNSLSSVPNLGYLSRTPYVDLEPGSNKLTFISAFSTTPLKDTTVSLTANSYYSAFIAGPTLSPSMVLVSDNLTAPTAGKAKIRLINLSSDNLNESVFVKDGLNVVTKLDSNVTYKLATPFREVTAGTYDLTVGDPASLPTAITLAGQSFGVGKIYTVIVTGAQAATGTGARKLTIIANN
jgi:hypothetical protein